MDPGHQATIGISHRQLQRMISETFCAAPWTVYCVNANGTAAVCCVNQQHKVPVDQHQQLLSSDRLQQIKQQMLAGHRVSGCEKCYSNEAAGIRSLRQHYNDYTGPALDTTQLTNRDYEARVWYDLSLSNLCNQKCRICGEFNSTAWHKDAVSLRDLTRSQHHGKTLGPHTDTVLIHSHSAIPHVIHSMQQSPAPFTIELKGGEPLYMQTSADLLQQMVDLGLHEHTAELRIMTNGTQSDPRIIQLLSLFPAVNMSLSIDAVGRLHEYTRGTNLTWDQCRHSWQQLLTLSNIKTLRVSNTIYAYTVLALPELIHWVSAEFGSSVRMSHSMLYKPEFLRANLVSTELRLGVLQSLGHNHSLSQALTQESSDSADTVALQRQQFKIYTQRLDQLRGESLLDLVPQLAPLLA